MRYLGGIQILHRIFTEELGLYAQILVKAPDGGDLPRSGSGLETVTRFAAAGIFHAVAGQIGKVFVHLRERNGGDKAEVDIVNRDFIQFGGALRKAPAELQEAKEHSKIQEVFVHSGMRVPPDGLVVAEKIPEDLGRLSSVVHMITSVPTIL
jgi:hypothetical protein